ncbi:hypothetical protein OA45_00064 [Bacillus sp. UMTAT18]|uniref:DUF4238 domain-containing protein n=1 Tax=Bacillus TaxID=1386 RepID=UPI0006186915|nr:MULTISPECIES: DUF4238 domain-containing protein [unclassified Bacillus (in: firmicutes)]KKC56428.1 hypothetical protein OA45_00064 [Bacillus sp. UMTAT18]OJD77550.1 hypothetical protein BAU29_18695 [Bacillus sp. P14-1]
MGRVKNEHYVPQSYLKAFANNKEQLFVYDKIKKTSYINKVNKVAAEGKFFDLPLPEGVSIPEVEKMNKEQLIEKHFAEDIEGPYKNYLNQIRTRYVMTVEPKGKVAITEEEKTELAYLITVQMLRTKQHRENVGAMQSKFLQALIDGELTRKSADYEHGEVKVKVPEVNTKILQASMLFKPETTTAFAKELEKHCWFVLVNNTEQPFYTSDNPVVRYAHKRDELRSYGGIASEGVEIALPISSKLMLVMMERSYHSHWLPTENKFFTVDVVKIVDFYNSLQVVHSHRQIFCSENKFKLVEQIKEERPEVLDSRDNVEVYANGKVY